MLEITKFVPETEKYEKCIKDIKKKLKKDKRLRYSVMCMFRLVFNYITWC